VSVTVDIPTKVSKDKFHDLVGFIDSCIDIAYDTRGDYFTKMFGKDQSTIRTKDRNGVERVGNYTVTCHSTVHEVFQTDFYKELRQKGFLVDVKDITIGKIIKVRPTFFDAVLLLDQSYRSELRDHAFGDREVSWCDQEGNDIGFGYAGAGSVRVSVVNGDYFDDKEADILIMCGKLKRVERNDSTGPDDYRGS